MAKVSAHGKEIGTIYFTTSAKRYMADGVILKNNGFGWKLAGKVKAGVNPADAYQNQLKYQNDLLAARPCTVAYRRALHELAGMNTRWKLHMVIEMMPDDADGVWSGACDGYGDNVHADIDEVSELCRLYQNAVKEQAAMKSTAPAMAD